MGLSLCVPVNLIDKVSCRRVRDLGFESAYTKNKLVYWPDGKSNHYRMDAIDSNAILTIKKYYYCLINTKLLNNGV